MTCSTRPLDWLQHEWFDVLAWGLLHGIESRQLRLPLERLKSARLGLCCGFLRSDLAIARKAGPVHRGVVVGSNLRRRPGLPFGSRQFGE
jgi:hypothetical protein